MKHLKDKTLLIISSLYPHPESGVVGDTFTKNEVDALKEYFKEIIIISQTPYYPKILLPLKLFSNTITDYALLYNYTYDNVRVFYPRYFSFPKGILEGDRGDNFYYRLRECIWKNNIKFDLVHAHFSYPSGYAGMKIAWDYNKKYMITLHEIHSTRIKELTDNPRIISAWANADILVNVNTNTIRYLEELQDANMISPNTELAYIPNMIDTTVFYPDIIGANKLGLARNKKVLLTVANLNQKKGLLELVDTIDILRHIRKDFILYIIGDGPLRKRIENKIKKYELTEYIKLLGPINNNLLPAYYTRADLFILNSYVESFGVVLIESLACGTPIISTENGGSEDIIREGINGYIIPSPLDRSVLALTIIKALDREWDKKILINTIKMYDKDKIKYLLLEKYGRLLE